MFKVLILFGVFVSFLSILLIVNVGKIQELNKINDEILILSFMNDENMIKISKIINQSPDQKFDNNANESVSEREEPIFNEMNKIDNKIKIHSIKYKRLKDSIYLPDLILNKLLHENSEYTYEFKQRYNNKIIPK